MHQADAPYRGRAAVAVALTALLVSGCAPPGQTYVVYDPIPAEPPLSATAPLLPEPQPVVPLDGFGLEDGLPAPANAACMSAVGERAGDFNLRVLENEVVGDGTEITIGVGENLNRWRCVADSSGTIVEVSNASTPDL